jgi:hypothetical protein
MLGIFLKNHVDVKYSFQNPCFQRKGYIAHNERVDSMNGNHSDALYDTSAIVYRKDSCDWQHL